MHILCTICSDLVNQAENIYVTKCGHIFHHHCLAQWIERSKSCPQCRHRVTEKCMVRLYPTISNELNAEDAATLQSRLDDALLQLRQQKASSKEKDDNLNNLNVELKKNVDLIKTFEKRLTSRESAISALKEQLDYLKIQNKETNRLKEENDALRKNLEMLNGLQKVLNATADEVEKMLESYTDVRTIAVFATALKRALCESEAKKKDYRDKLHSTKQQYTVEKDLVASLQANNVRLSERIDHLTRKYEALKNKKHIKEILSGGLLDPTVPGKSSDRSEGEAPAKQPRLDASVLNTDYLDINDINISLETMDTIEKSSRPLSGGSLDQTLPGKSSDRSESETLPKEPRLDASVLNTVSLALMTLALISMLNPSSSIHPLIPRPNTFSQRIKELISLSKDDFTPNYYDDPVFNDAMDIDADYSVNSMVNRIKNADSPYLNLKQSSVALALSDRHRAFSLPATGIKPSEFAIINSARSHALKSSESNALSIFHRKQPMKPEPPKADLDVSYDGLGGHSKLDTFPVPKQRPMLKYVPKLSAKHKLKKPSAPSGSQDIGKFLQKMSQD